MLNTVGDLALLVELEAERGTPPRRWFTYPKAEPEAEVHPMITPAEDEQ